MYESFDRRILPAHRARATAGQEATGQERNGTVGFQETVASGGVNSRQRREE